MATWRDHAADVYNAFTTPSKYCSLFLRLVGVRGEEQASDNDSRNKVRDRLVGLIVGLSLLLIVCAGPQPEVKRQIEHMSRYDSGFPIAAIFLGIFAFPLLALALQIIAVCAGRSFASRITRFDLVAATMKTSLWLLTCTCSLAMNLSLFCFRGDPEEVGALFTLLTAVATMFAIAFLVNFAHRVWKDGGAANPLTVQIAQELGEPVANQGREVNPEREANLEPENVLRQIRQRCWDLRGCCVCCGVSTSVLWIVLAIIFSIDWGIGSGPTGVPIPEAQWKLMNSRDLVFAEMSLNMVQKLGNDWGRNPQGIANKEAYSFRPQPAEQSFRNSYIDSVEEMSLVGFDQYIFPGEVPYDSPRWSVVRIKRKLGDVLVVVFRGSSGDERTALDWTTFDALNDPSQVVQEDGVRFTRGFFDESLCIFMEQGLFKVLNEHAEGITEVFTTGYSLGGAWASILMSRLAPKVQMTCPGGKKFGSPFGSLFAESVTFGKPGPFYVSNNEQTHPKSLNFASRETDYVYHGDSVARANHGGVKHCSGLCWTAVALFGGPFFKFGHVSYIQNHYHGDTTTIWIMNDMKGGNAPTALRGLNLLKATRDQIGVYYNEVDRSMGINMGFFIGRLPPLAGIGAGLEHGMAYAWNLWYNYERGSQRTSAHISTISNADIDGIRDSHSLRLNTSTTEAIWLI